MFDYGFGLGCHRYADHIEPQGQNGKSIHEIARRDASIPLSLPSIHSGLRFGRAGFVHASCFNLHQYDDIFVRIVGYEVRFTLRTPIPLFKNIVTALVKVARGNELAQIAKLFGSKLVNMFTFGHVGKIVCRTEGPLFCTHGCSFPLR